MTKSSTANGVVSLNKSLERIKAGIADIRLSLMQKDFEIAGGDFWEAKKIDDCIALCQAKSLGAKYQFGMLIGYFDECWWSGIVLFKTDDLEADRSEKLQSVGDSLRQSGDKILLSNKHYVYVDFAGGVECEDFGEFMPKVLKSINANKDLLCRLNEAVKKLA